MSRIGKQPVPLPSGVTVAVHGAEVTVKGPKGTLTKALPAELGVSVQGQTVAVTRPSDSRLHRELHGLTRTLVANMVDGVTTGFERTLLIVGVGYRASKQGSALQLAIGFSHPVTVDPPAGIEFALDGQTKITVKGIDKQLVGQVASNLRAIRPPEPYKGKGIKYDNEVIHRKVGKAGKVAGGK